MRKKFFAAMIVITAISVVTGYYWHSGSVKAMGININKKDLPEHGLKIIGPSDPSFDGLLKSALEGEQSALVEDVRPFSIFIKNDGNKAIVAYQLTWELDGPEGRIISYQPSYANPRVFFDEDVDKSDNLTGKEGNIIKPKATRLFSMAKFIGGQLGGNIGALAAPLDETEASEAQQKAQNGVRSSAMQRIHATLKRGTNLTVSIDGAFFEDGTFVGPDTTGFFADFKAQTDARRDILVEIAHRLNRGETHDAIFSRIDKLANAPDAPEEYMGTPKGHYHLFKRLNAREIAGMPGAIGREKTIAFLMYQLNKQIEKHKDKSKPHLRKKD